MSATGFRAAMGTWQADGHRLRVEYSRMVMAEIRAAVVDGYHRLHHGGVGIGGVLFGARNGDTVRLLSWRPIPCRHARGPSFLLAPEDEAELARLLSTCGRDPALAGLAPVGWFHSHTRGQICLSESDVALYDRFFPEPWQIALVLRPERFGTTRVGVFFREAGGRIRTESSYREFEIESGLAPRPQGDNGRRSGSAAVPLEAPATRPVAAAPVAATPRHTRWLPAAMITLLLAGVGGAGLIRALSRTPDRPVALHVAESGGQLEVGWDRTARPLVEADRGRLLIWDGPAARELALDRSMLRLGRVVYARQSGEVRIRLLLEKRGAATAQETVQFLAPPAGDSR
jgi:proteasome lid subunit RPN8/RPN11